DGAHAGADDFFVGSSDCVGPLPPGASCQFRVRFAPQGQGARSAVMQIYTNAPGVHTDILLNGTGGPVPLRPKGVPEGKGAHALTTRPARVRGAGPAGVALGVGGGVGPPGAGAGGSFDVRFPDRAGGARRPPVERDPRAQAARTAVVQSGPSPPVPFSRMSV